MQGNLLGRGGNWRMPLCPEQDFQEERPSHAQPYLFGTQAS